MTNREWLNCLSNDELAEWLCDSKLDVRLTNMCNTNIFTGVGTIKMSYTDSLLGLKKWLGDEHYE